METSAITINVTPRAANFYKSVSEQERRKLNALLSLRLSEAATPSRSLNEIIREASSEAKKNGLTEEILTEILNEE